MGPLTGPMGVCRYSVASRTGEAWRLPPAIERINTLDPERGTMRYDTWYEGRPERHARPRLSHRRRARRRGEPLREPPLPPPDRRVPFPLEGRGYTGPGEAGRYGDAPVPYGPEHTYDYHLGDRYGYGPDFIRGEERIRKHHLPEFRERWRRRR